MSWPPPTTTTAATTAPPSAQPEPKQPPELVRLLRSVAPATWVALLGGALVLIASAIVTASNWATVGLVARALALTVVCVGLGFAAPRLRRTAPTTATVIAHIAAFVAAPAGMAVMSSFGYTWPACVLAGGLLAAGATQLAGRTWRSDTMNAGQVVALAVAATGLGAITGTPAGVLAVGAAVGLLVAGATRRAVGLAVAALVSPVLWGLAASGIGSGTLTRAGLIGGQLGWAGPVTGAIAGVVLLIAGRQIGRQAVSVAAVMSPVIGLVTGFAAIDAPGYAWLCLPAMLLTAAELGGCGRLFERCSIAICGTGALAAIPAFAAREALGEGASVPASLTAAAAVLLVARRRRTGHDDSTGLAAIATCTVVAVALLAPPAPITIAVAVMALAGSAYLSRTLHPFAVYVPATMALTTIASHVRSDAASRLIDLVALAGLVALVVAARTRVAGNRQIWGTVEVSLVTMIASATTAAIAGGHQAMVWLIAVAVVSTSIALLEQRFVIWSLQLVFVVSLPTTMLLVQDGFLDGSFWFGWVAIAVGWGVLAVVRRSATHAYAAAVAAVVAGVTAMAGHQWSVDRMIGAAMLCAVVLTGLALAVGRRTPVDSAAVAVGAAVALLTLLGADPMLASAAWLAIGLQIGVYGVALADRRLQLGGALVALAATVSGWFTSGANDWALGVLDAVDVRPADLWLLAMTGAAAVGGTVMHRRFALNAWIAYAGMFVIGEAWLGSVQASRETAWAIPAAITFGMLATCAGAWRKIPALIAGGIGVTATTLVLASGRDLRQLPTWVWLAAGGLVLLAIAVVIERRGATSEAG